MITRVWVAMVMGILCILLVPQLLWAEEAGSEQDETEQLSNVQDSDKKSDMMEKMMGMRGKKMRMSHHGMMNMPDMAALMELEPAQRTAYLDLVTKSQKQFLDIREQLILNRIALQEVMAAPQFDKAKATELADKQAQLAAQRLQNSLNLAIELRAMGLSSETISCLGHYSMSPKAGKGMRGKK